MLFNEFGAKENPTVLLLHGMMQDWHSEYEVMKPLEKQYHLIIPAMDGFYEGSSIFTSFADQARQIEEYVQKHYGGKLFGMYGASQGGLMAVEILTRNNISIKTAFLDGTYVAHQGKIAGIVTAKMFLSAQRNGGKFPKVMDYMIYKMGLDDSAYQMMDNLYWNADEESVKRNFLENYTYRTRSEIAKTTTRVYLCCGSKEPYAIKSHNELKKYLTNYEENIIEGMGHGEMMFKRNGELIDMIIREFER